MKLLRSNILGLAVLSQLSTFSSVAMTFYEHEAQLHPLLPKQLNLPPADLSKVITHAWQGKTVAPGVKLYVQKTHQPIAEIDVLYAKTHGTEDSASQMVAEYAMAEHLMPRTLWRNNSYAMNILTMPDLVAFKTRFTPATTPQVLQDLPQQLRFTADKEDLQRAQAQYRREIDFRHNNELYPLNAAFRNAEFQGTPDADMMLPSPENRTSDASAKRAMQRLNRDQISIVAEGDFSDADIARLRKIAIAARRREAASDDQPIQTTRLTKRLIQMQPDEQVAIAKLGLTAAPLRQLSPADTAKQDALAYTLAKRLGNTTLFDAVRLAKAPMYRYRTAHELSLLAKPNTTQAAIQQTISRTIADLAKNGINEAELAAFKLDARNNLKKQLGTVDGRISLASVPVTQGLRPDYYEQVASACEALTPEAVNEYAPAFLDPSKRVLAILAPKKSAITDDEWFVEAAGRVPGTVELEYLKKLSPMESANDFQQLMYRVATLTAKPSGELMQRFRGEQHAVYDISARLQGQYPNFTLAVTTTGLPQQIASVKRQLPSAIKQWMAQPLTPDQIAAAQSSILRNYAQMNVSPEKKALFLQALQDRGIPSKITQHYASFLGGKQNQSHG